MTAISLLLLVGLFSAAGAIMAYYFLKNPDILFAGKSPANPTKTAIHLKFEGGEFLIPSYLLSKVRHSALREVKKISLTIPINWTPEHRAVTFNAKSDLSEWLLARIEKRTNPLSHKDWLSRIYRHYIAAPAISHSSGLLRYRFKPTSPYSSIELFTDSLQAPTLIIRCEMQNSTLGTRLCARQIKISSKTMVEYKFPRSEIDRWQKIHLTMQNLLAHIYTQKGI